MGKNVEIFEMKSRLIPSGDSDNDGDDSEGIYMEVLPHRHHSVSSYTDSELLYTDLDEEDELVKPKESSWPATSATIVANMIGVGILGLPAAFAQMGWAVSAGVLIVMALISTYSSLILAWLRGSVTEITTYPGLAAFVTKAGGRNNSLFYKHLSQILLYTFLQGVCTLYLITMKLSLESIFQQCADADANTNVNTTTTIAPTTTAGSITSSSCERTSCASTGLLDLPDTLWLLIAAGFVFPFVHFRRLAHATWLSVVGVLTITAVNVIIILRCIQRLLDGDHSFHTIHTHHRTFRDLINGIATVVFSYGGHGVLLDIFSEMKEPAKFPRAVYSSQTFMFLNYAIVGFLGFGAFGYDVSSPITLSLPNGWLHVATNACLLIHVAAAYCINSTVFVKNLFKMLWPELYRSPYFPREKAVRWGFLATLVLLVAFTIAVVIPYFRDIMNLVSAVSVFSLSIWLPALLFVQARKAEMSTALLFFNVVVVLAGIGGVILAFWAAFDDVVDQVRDCSLGV
eukprot:m.177610 g.177610  ORF g.177610 m.177610 type:complete len:514 (+) comp16575_c0_seq2:64-1605(+)